MRTLQSSMPPTGAKGRLDPACGTCRRKCRKCDRTRPNCLRCISKGLTCEGYPLSFKIYDGRATTRKRDRRAVQQHALEPAATASIEETSPTTSTHSNDVNSQGSPPARLQEAMRSIRNTGVDGAPVEADIEEVQHLLTYYETTICTVLPVPTANVPNPFSEYILPLAYRDTGLLNAVLGLTACHIATRDARPNGSMGIAAVQHRLAAIRSLSSLLLKEECFGLSDTEEEIALAIVLTLVLHDICDCGKSMHGAHLNGVAFLCSRIANSSRCQNPCKLFLVTALTWFDLLRGFSGAEKLAFPSDTRRFVAETAGIALNTLVGCPPDIFSIIGQTLSAGKKFWNGELNVEDFQTILDQLLPQLRTWDPSKGPYPSDDREWTILADAYRHAAILRIWRFPDTWVIPCSDERIRASVTAILDASAAIPWHSPYFKRLLFPLFVAGADTDSPHQQRYVSLCIDHIRESTGFTYESLYELLNKTWDDRSRSDGKLNVPWFEYTCSAHLERQHDYLFF
ncbi:fungal-specific transcription factor domain-containing protein [Lophiotrema nucula]|uniref:Fungal-specific transcription factor domain-containing protein n=1 Tax=Lophiotrema nucula TaxID=690887 RepID=A0A6A5ZMD3_9PLEO|nr:fungal-specific transcription factor domain-containing protein [Lophiotrema nucula]